MIATVVHRGRISLDLRHRKYMARTQAEKAQVLRRMKGDPKMMDWLHGRT
jgi:hypothetical protein